MKSVSVAVAVAAMTFLLVSVPAFAQESAARADSAGASVALNGIRMYYEEAGSGPPLVLLHFFGGCGAVWEPHVERLASDYRLIIPDLRAHGRSTNAPGEFTHRQAARDVFALLDELGVDRFRAMGMSSGGMTLLHMATQQPERVEAMVLIGATSYFPGEAREIMRGTNPGTVPEAEIEQMRACASRGDAQVQDLLGLFHGMKDSYDDMNFTAPYLSTITASTLIVHGDRDEYFPVEIPAGMYAAIPDAYLWIVPNGGHLPVYGERSGPLLDTVLEFLDGRWAAQAP